MADYLFDSTSSGKHAAMSRPERRSSAPKDACPLLLKRMRKRVVSMLTAVQYMRHAVSAKSVELRP
jgi:hypothetical protein